MSGSPYVSVQYGGDIDITKDIPYETELYYNILKYGLSLLVSVDHFHTGRIEGFWSRAISRILYDKEHQNSSFNFIILEFVSKPFIIIFY